MTINRPEARNALNAEVAAGIAAAMDLLDRAPELRVGVLTGAGGFFSAGMDLKAFVGGATPFIEGQGLCGITVIPPRQPLIAAVEGWAVAGGFEFLLACDLVVASRHAKLGVPEVKRGLVAASGGALLLPRRLPLAVALELLLTGDPIMAGRAYELGLVNHLTSAGEALDGAGACERDRRERAARRDRVRADRTYGRQLGDHGRLGRPGQAGQGRARVPARCRASQRLRRAARARLARRLSSC